MLLDDDLDNLGEYLMEQLELHDCDHTRTFTEHWLHQGGILQTARVLEALEAQGGYCDCEVLLNVVWR